MPYLLSNICTKKLLESDNFCWNYCVVVGWYPFFETQCIYNITQSIIVAY